MNLLIFKFVIVQCFMLKMSSANYYRSQQEYQPLSGYQYPVIPMSPPPYNSAALNPHNQIPEVRKQLTLTQDPPLSTLSLTNYLASLSQSPAEQQRPVQNTAPCTNNIDAKLLNNLAVALQLLIVSNILHSPPPEAITEKAVVKTESAYQTPEIKYNPHQLQYYMAQEQAMPFQSYVPYAEANSVQKCELSKKSLPVIQSPYEAILSSPHSEQMATYSPGNSRRDLLSPYAMIAKDTNTFPFSDLF